MFRYFLSLLFVTAMFLAGCQHAFKESSSDPKSARPPVRRDTRIYVGTPPNAVYKKEPVLDSGHLTGDALKNAFSKISGAVFIGRKNELFTEALERAGATRSQYLVYPTILAWEDHPTEWNGIRDKIEIKIEIVDVATAEILYTTRIKARSRFMTDGEDRPEMLLQEPFDKFAESLLKTESIPSALR